MVAVSRSVLAFGIASLSLADAAAVPISEPGSPSKSPSKSPTKSARHQESGRVPMPRLILDSKRDRANSSPKRSKFPKSRVTEVKPPLGEASVKRQQEQAAFDVFHVPRQQLEVCQDPTGTPGHVDITSPVAGGNATKLASLMLNSTTDNLDASTDQYSMFCMVPIDGTQAPSARRDVDQPMQVTLQMLNPDDNTTSCAQFDPNPPAPEPLRMGPCITASNGTTSHTSQTFIYHDSTGVIQPMWFNGEDDGTHNTTGSVTQRDADSQDVTLVFVREGASSATEVVSPDSSSGSSQSSSPSMSSQTASSMTVSDTASAAPSLTIADVGAAGSASQSASDSSSASMSSPSASSTPVFTAADVPTSSTTDVSPSTAASSTTDALSQSTSSADAYSSSASVTKAGAFQVEVAVSSSDSASPSSTASTAPPFASPDAAAVASDIVASDASSSGSASATSSASAADAAPSVVPLTGEEQVVYVGSPAPRVGSPAPRAEMTPVSTDPYTWHFAPEPRGLW